MIGDTLYKYDQTIIKVYGCGEHKSIKVINMNVLRTAGLELDDLDKPIYHRGQKTGEKKSDENIMRAKAKIFELAYCNPWELFFTGTLNPEKYDRTDLPKYHSDFTQYIGNYNKHHNTNIKFLVIPELHKDGKSWHMHGFLHGLPSDCLYRFEIGDQMGRCLADKVKCGDVVYRWNGYADRFGFCDLEPIKNPEAVSRYATKYICKDLSKSVSDVGAHMYYHSRGLQFAQTVKRGYMSTPIDTQPSYTNDYCKVWWLPYSDDLLGKLVNRFE